MQLARPEMLWLLALLPLWMLLRARRGRDAAVRFGRVDLAKEAGKAQKTRLGLLAPGLRLATAGLIIVALARPQRVDQKTSVHASGVDMILAIDVSGSMSAQDFENAGERTSRLNAVKKVVRDFVKKRPNDRIGVVAFAGRPFLVSPLTLDHGWVDQNLERVEIGMVEDGTAVGDALAMSVDRLQKADAESRLVVLLTDGVNNKGKMQPELAAEAASSLGVKVYTVGAGGEGYAPMPTDAGRVVMQEVEVDEETLQGIADRTGGTYFRAADTDALEAVYAEIDRMETTDRELSRHVRTEERFQYAAVPAAFLLAAELLVRLLMRPRIP